MGVYIKGMTLGELNDCVMVGAYIAPEDAVEVTEPHGRLIDEAEVRVIMHQVCARSRRTYEATECAIRNMKAVIEAEGE